MKLDLRSNWTFAVLVILVFAVLPSCIGDLAGCLGCSDEEIQQLADTFGLDVT